MSIKKNSIFGFLAAALPILVAIAVVPLYLGEVGKERYAILSVAWVFLGYFGLFDFGLSRAVAQSISLERRAGADSKSNTIWVALVLSLLLGFVAALLLYWVALYYFSNFLSADQSIRAEMINAAFLLSLLMPVATVSGVAAGAHQGLEKFVQLNATGFISAIGFQLVPLFLAKYYSENLSVLIGGVLLVRVLVLCFLLLSLMTKIGRRQQLQWTKAKARALLQYGGWISVSSVVSPVMTALDQIIIGAMTSARELAYYVIPQNVVTKISVIPNSLGAVIFPRMAVLNPQESAQLSDKSMRVLAGLLTPVVVVGVMGVGPFFVVWVGVDIARHSTQIAQILLLGIWFNVIAQSPFVRLQAMGRPDLTAKLHIFELPFYVLILYLLLSAFGVLGAAAAWAIRMAVDAIALLILSGMSRGFGSRYLTQLAFIVLAVYINYDSLMFDGSQLLGNMLVLIAWFLFFAFSDLRFFRSLFESSAGHS